jgi:Low psii accumulation1 / Rep27
MKKHLNLISRLVLILTLCKSVVGFTVCKCNQLQRLSTDVSIATKSHHRSITQASSLWWLSAFNSNDHSDNTKPEYTRELLLREEAESPFRNVRFFAYISLGLGALTSFGISAARIAAATLANINTDLLNESLTNAGVDIVGIVVLSVLYQRDVAARESRLKRAAKGAELAKLKVRASKNIVQGSFDDEVGIVDEKNISYFTTSLASLRRGRGIEKRVVIAVGGKEKIAEIIQQALEIDRDLVANDLLIVPVVLPQGVAPVVTASTSAPQSLAFPVTLGPGMNSWSFVMSDEADEATKQGIDVQKDGFCIVLKKNGRVGQRTKGINLFNMIGEVASRREAGMDVKNI